MSVERTPLEYLIGGAVGGFCVAIVGHPFDTIKVRLQMEQKGNKNMYHLLRNFFIKEGPLSLYKGVSAPLITVIPLSAMGFFSYGAGKLLVSKPDQTKLTDIQLLLSGMFSGACTSFIAAPSERIKCLLQAQRDIGTKRQYKGFMDCMKKLYHEGGIRNIYLGTCVTLLRDVPSCGTYFYTYERLMGILLNSSEEMTWQPLLAGGIAGVVTWLVSLPADSIKTRLQASPMNMYPYGMRSVLPIIMKEGGFLALYRGVTTVMIRAFIANAACFYGFELAFDMMDKFSNT
ncbi:congested-like trachea protein [Vespula maculifrons]|uniref:Congested-like trachea protein n=1 Tax=Vespula maculifrons TaxID=7453 RepID=A0ABD2CT35_VESMC